MDPLTSRCTATAKSTGERCRRWVRGGGVCVKHGGRAPQVAAKREARIIAGQALQLGGDGLVDRSPADALLSAAKDADLVIQRLKSQVRDGKGLNLATLGVLGDWIDRVGRLSKVVIDAKLDERAVQLAQADADRVVNAFTETVKVLNLTPADKDLAIQTFLDALDRGLDSSGAVVRVGDRG